MGSNKVAHNQYRSTNLEGVEGVSIKLTHMYGSSKTLHTVFEIHHQRYERTHRYLSHEIKDAVLKRLKDYGGTKQRLSQLLDEEQQRELEQELEEERQSERPPPVKPCEPILHEEIRRLSDKSEDTMDLAQFPHVFRHLPYAFTGTTFFSECEANSWQSNFWISTEFQRVIETEGESLNPLLRPPRWVIIYRNQHLIYVSALEANWLLGRLNCLYHERQFINSPSTTALRLLLPRIKRNQSIFVDTPTLTIPPLLGHSNDDFIPLELEQRKKNKHSRMFGLLSMVLSVILNIVVIYAYIQSDFLRISSALSSK